MPKSAPRRRRDPEATRAVILAAAADEFVANGLAGARMGAIAAAASVPQGLIYHYYPSKKALFFSVLRSVSEPYFEGIASILANPDGRDGRELLEFGIRSYFGFLRGNPAFLRLMTWARSAGVWAEITAEFGNVGCDSTLFLGAARLREAQEAGQMRPDLDPLHIMKVWLDVCQNWFLSFDDFVLDAKLDADDEEAIARIHERHLDHICSMILAGLAPPTPPATPAP